MPMRVSRGLLPCLLLILLAGPAFGEQELRGEGWLTSKEQITAAVSDATHVRSRADGSEEVEYHSADGRVAYFFDGCLWSGEWWVDGSQVCYRYPSLSGLMAHCFHLRDGPAGMEFWSVDDEESHRPLAVVEALLDGNPRNLSLDAGGRCQET